MLSVLTDLVDIARKRDPCVRCNESEDRSRVVGTDRACSLYLRVRYFYILIVSV